MSVTVYQSAARLAWWLRCPESGALTRPRRYQVDWLRADHGGAAGCNAGIAGACVSQRGLTDDSGAPWLWLNPNHTNWLPKLILHTVPWMILPMFCKGLFQMHFFRMKLLELWLKFNWDLFTVGPILIITQHNQLINTHWVSGIHRSATCCFQNIIPVWCNFSVKL